MNIDEQLLSKNNDFDETKKAGQFRASLRAQEVDGQGVATNFRQQVKEKKNLEVAIQSKAIESVERDNPIRKLTDRLLQGAWKNLIPSWGLTLLWIDLHVFLNQVFGPTVFRELGEEWIPAGLKKIGDGQDKGSVSLIKIVEKSGCACLNLGCLFLILGVIVIISIITAPLSEQFKMLLDIFSGGSSIKDITDLVNS